MERAVAANLSTALAQDVADPCARGLKPDGSLLFRRSWRVAFHHQGAGYIHPRSQDQFHIRWIGIFDLHLHHRANQLRFAGHERSPQAVESRLRRG